MSTTEEENKDLARELFKAFDTHDKELAMEILADDVGQRKAPDSDWNSGKDAYWVRSIYRPADCRGPWLEDQSGR